MTASPLRCNDKYNLQFQLYMRFACAGGLAARYLDATTDAIRVNWMRRLFVSSLSNSALLHDSKYMHLNTCHCIVQPETLPFGVIVTGIVFLVPRPRVET